MIFIFPDSASELLLRVQMISTYVSNATTIPPNMRRKLLAAYVTVYPIAGIVLSRLSWMAPSAATAFLPPATHPSVTAAGNLNR